ncbi:phage tail protein [Burkholderia vietnamiensis]|uniref:phage tail protein n=1 Tax=Burkholderia vietnamiensis TaxID=60552 RepID=UPI001CF33B0F|nr:phage tail protein [Burkholderia vietnamiensis]MCA8180995.1 phage tail protein [Burkholderia vietnamiensis]
MAGNLIQITDAGRAALVAPGNTGTVARRVVEIGLGTAAFTFNKGMKALPNERKRVTSFGGENVAPDTVHVVIQDDSNDQYSLYAYGLYLDNGVLFGVYVQNTPILEKSPSAMLLLASDIVFASIDAAQLQFGPATFLNPPATTERKGVAELATQAEVDAGIDDTRIVTPKGAAMRYMPFVGGRFTGPVKIAKGTGAIPDDGSSVLQAIGDSRTTGKSFFGTGAKAGRAHADADRFYVTADGDVQMGSSGAAGNLSLMSGNVARAVLTQDGRILFGKNQRDDGVASMQLMPETPEGFALAIYRAAAFPQAIKIGASPSATTRNENVIESFSALDNAKPLVISATTDETNADPSRGVVAIWLQVLGQTKAVLNKDGQLLLGVGTAASGPALLQVGGSARFAGLLYRGSSNAMLVGSTDSAGIQNAGTGGDAAINNARFSADAIGPAINLGKSRGTAVGAQAAVKGEDVLGTVYFCGSDGSKTLMGAAILAAASSDFTSTSRAARLDFHTVANGATGSSLRMRITADGRVLFGTADDNGLDMIQSRGSIYSSGGVRSSGYDSGGTGAQFRAISTDYGVMLRNDNKSAWFLSTKKGDAYGTYNDYRPFAWSLDTGAVRIDGSGAGTAFGGYVRVAGNLEGSGIAYFAGGASQAKSYGSGVILGANAGGGVVLKCATADVNMKMWDVQSNETQLNMRAVDDEWTQGIPFLTATRENKSNAIRSLALVPAGGRVQVAGAPDDGSSALAARGTIKGVNSNGALIASNGGGTGQTSIQLKRDGAPVDQKTWELMTGGDGALSLRTVNDAYSNSQSAISVSRASGYSLGAMQLMPQGGRVLIGSASDDQSVLVNVGGLIAASAPPTGDSSNKLVTSAWVTAAILNAQVGQIVWEARTGVRAGYLKLNGAELKRADYPALWAYAQASGALVSQADWAGGRWGCFSTGDGTTTFRLPEMRGEFIRCWADGRNDIDPQRAIGSYQGDQNRSHAHGASASEVGDHVHSAWTDAQGQHNHPLHDPGHAHGVRMGRVGVVATSYGQGWGPYNWDRQDMHGTEGAGTGIWLDDAGNHGHNVGIGGAGRHSHGITVNADGGNEARPRNVALLAMIRAY